MEVRQPGYYSRFHCIASACPDSCCQLWDVEIDPETADAYQAVTGPLGDLLHRVLYREDDATYIRLGQDQRCPFWRQDGLCRIQAELGAQALSHVCTEFPRLFHDFGDFAERGLELSCPEAARLILTEPFGDDCIVSAPDGEPDYDHTAMDCLKRTRKQAVSLLTDPRFAPNEALALLLVYGCQAQGELDGDEPAPFDPAAALELAAQLAQPGGREALLSFFRSLEVLTPDWQQRLDCPGQPLPWGELFRNLGRYFVERYWLQAVSDYDLVCRVKLAVVSCLAVQQLGGDPLRTAQLYSKEIENDADNVDALLDGCYDEPALTDAALLGLLLG